MAAHVPTFDPVHGFAAMVQLDFMRRAFLAGTALALVAGLAGYFVVLRRLAFAGDALSHVAFTGALAAAALGAPPVGGLFGLTVAAGLGLGFLGERARARDEAIGTVLAWVLGLGVLFLSIYTTNGGTGNGALGVNVLFGSIFGLQEGQARLAAILGGIVALVLLAMTRPLLFASLDPDVAAARGVPVRALGLLFLLLLGAGVAEAVQAVGALLIFSLLVTPAATAMRLTSRPYRALALSAALALALTWTGLLIAYALPLPVSFVISALAFGVYCGAVVCARS